MKNRVPKQCQLPGDKQLQKEGRGASVLAVRKSPELAITKWSNNKPVLMASTVHGKDPEDICTSWSNKEKAMSKTKKWKSRVITHFFDVAITNSWIQYKSDSKALNRPAKNTEQYLDFKLHLAEELSDSPEHDDSSEDSEEEYEPPTKMWIPQPEPSVRRLGAMHMLEMVDIKHAERCRNKGCK
eukprot:superscaffoldBa00008893_g23703